MSSLRELFLLLIPCLNLKLACVPSVSSGSGRNGVCKTFWFFFFKDVQTLPRLIARAHSRNKSGFHCNDSGDEEGGQHFITENSFVF